MALYLNLISRQFNGKSISKVLYGIIPTRTESFLFFEKFMSTRGECGKLVNCRRLISQIAVRITHSLE